MPRKIGAHVPDAPVPKMDVPGVSAENIGFSTCKRRKDAYMKKIAQVAASFDKSMNAMNGAVEALDKVGEEIQTVFKLRTKTHTKSIKISSEQTTGESADHNLPQNRKHLPRNLLPNDMGQAATARQRSKSALPWPFCEKAQQVPVTHDSPDSGSEGEPDVSQFVRSGRRGALAVKVKRLPKGRKSRSKAGPENDEIEWI